MDLSVLDESALDGLREALGPSATELKSLAELPLVEGLSPGAVRGAVEVALSAVDVTLMGTRRLRELAPGAALVTDGPVAPDACGPRLRGILDRAGWDHWSLLLGQRVSDVAGLVNVGPKAVAELVGMCVERSVDGVGRGVGVGPARG